MTIQIIIAVLGAILGAASLVLHAIAPLTKTTVDDELRDDVDEIKAFIAKLDVAPQIAPASPAQKKPESGRIRFSLAALLAALGFASALVLASCATLKAMSGAWASCMGTDLGQLVKTEEGQLVPLSIDVAETIEGQPAALLAEAASVVKQVGIDAYDCAVTAYEQTHPIASGSAIVTSSSVVETNLAQLHAWIAAQRKAAK